MTDTALEMAQHYLAGRIREREALAVKIQEDMDKLEELDKYIKEASVVLQEESNRIKYEKEQAVGASEQEEQK